MRERYKPENNWVYLLNPTDENDYLLGVKDCRTEDDYRFGTFPYEWLEHRDAEAKAAHKACISARWKAASQPEEKGVLAWIKSKQVWAPVYWIASNDDDWFSDKNCWVTQNQSYEEHELEHFMLMPNAPSEKDK
jgi:hypothetical protein